MREQRKVVTVLFCDLVGSTALGESTDPEVVRQRLTRIFEDLRRILERHGGSVEKFVGDAVMAVFGIPSAHEDDALRAVRAADEMRAAIAEHGLEARIGINTGEVVVGGEGETLVTGDAVNVAARLEQAAPPGEIVIGAETGALVRDAVRTEPLAPLALKGKSLPVEAHRLVEVAEDAAPIARNLAAPLVGRERERQRLWRAFEDAAVDRTCQLFTLLGPAGMGKSRLVADFVDRLGDDADVLRGRCLSYGEGITYWPLVEMLVPLRLDVASVVATTPTETRVAFRKLLEARAAARPQVVVVDDLQWAEPEFFDLVEHVADLSRDASILLLCVARTELLDMRPDWGGGKLNATSLQLEPLADAERKTLIGNLLGEHELGAAARERIARASGGNPLFVEEMVAMVRESDEADELTVPPTIAALLQARIDSLDAALRVVLERAAVEGEVFHRSSVADLLPPHVRSGLDDQIAALVRKELIRPESSLIPGHEAYRFRHLLIREAVYATMPKVLRAELHESFADWLERTAEASLLELDEIVGYHLEQSLRFREELGDRDEALAARAGARLLEAGLAAAGRADLPAAAGLLQRALEVGALEERARLEGMLTLAQVLVRRGELERADTYLPLVVDAARGAGDQGALARARLAYNSLQTRIDPEATVEDELAEALEIAAELHGTDDLAALVSVYVEIGTGKFQLGRAGEGERDLERAFEVALETGDHALLRDTMSARLRPAGWGPMPAAEGAGLCGELLGADYANASLKAMALQILALFEAMLGDVEASRRAAADAWELTEEFQLTLFKGLYGGDVGLAEVLNGDLDRAEMVLRRSHDILVETGDTGVRSTVDALLADVLGVLGRENEALGFADASRRIAASDDLDSQPRWRVAAARVLGGQGRHDDALALLDEAVALVEPIDFLELKAHVHDVRGEVLARAGRVDEAAVAVERAIALHSQKGNLVSVARSSAALEELRAAARS